MSRLVKMDGGVAGLVLNGRLGVIESGTVVVTVEVDVVVDVVVVGIIMARIMAGSSSVSGSGTRQGINGVARMRRGSAGESR